MGRQTCGVTLLGYMVFVVCFRMFECKETWETQAVSSLLVILSVMEVPYTMPPHGK